MARAAVIPQSPPKRATRGKAKGASTQTASKSSAKVTKAAETKKRTARTAVAHIHSESDSEETDDEIGVIENKSRVKASGAKGKTGTSRTGRGRKTAATPEVESESEDDNDELAQSDAPKKRPGRPKGKASAKVETTKAVAGSRPRGRPKGTSVKVPSDDDILMENTRRNALSQDSDELSSSQQAPKEVFVTTGSALLRGPAKAKKKVTFQELTDSEAELSEAPAPTARRRRGTIVAKDDDGMAAKPFRKTPAGSSRGRKSAAGKKGSAKPLSPKKATQVAKVISAYASSDGEEDELSGEKDAIKLVVHSPQKRTSGASVLGSPVRRINFTPNKASNPVDENGEPTLPPPRTFDFSDSQFMSSPARRPPPSPFHFTLKETPRRAAIPLPEKPKSSRPETTPNQNSPLRTSPRKANIGTPARGSLFSRDCDAIPQPNFTPGQNSPLKMSARKGIFGASFSSQRPTQQQNSTPFKSSLLMSPARKVITPFKSSMTHVPSSLAKETQLHTETETDDETITMYDESPLRGQNLEVVEEFQANEPDESDVSADERDTGLTPDGSPVALQAGHLEGESSAESDHSAKSVEEEDEGMVSEEDDVTPLVGPELDEAVRQAEQDVQHMVKKAEDYLARADKEELLDYDEDEEIESPTPQSTHQTEPEASEFEDEPLENDQGHREAGDDESNTELVDERRPSPFRFSFADGLEDVFTDDYPARDTRLHYNTMHDEENGKDAVYDNEGVLDVHDSPRHGNEGPAMVGDAAAHHLISTGPVQPYEIEEVEDTPFMNFLLKHWAPTLPFVEDCEPTVTPFDTEHRSPQPITPEENQDDASDSPSLPIDSEHNTLKEPQEPSLRSRGLRFTLLAEQLSQWKASSPAKAEPRPRRRGVFSLGRPSDVPSTSSRTPKMDVFANAPNLSAKHRFEKEPTPQALDVHEGKEDESVEQLNEADEIDEIDDVDEVDEVDEAVGSESVHSTRRSMAEDMNHENSDWFDIFKDLSDHEEMEGEQAESANSPILGLSVEEKENDVPSPIPATPTKNPSLPRHTYHTVSKVPLKPEGEVSPLKINRKRGRSLSITSPVRSSPRLRNFVLPPQEPREAGSPPRKSPRLQYGSTRGPLPREIPSKPVPAQQTNRARTPSRSVSPVKSPVKQASGCLRGAVVYVDVHTTEGEDASGIFIELLQQMGARCIRNWIWNPRMSVSSDEDPASVNGKVGVTHVVFKDGGVRTLEKVRQAAGLVKCVGVGWVLNCEARNEWVDEAPYTVDSSIIPRGGAKRRKSMEPRALSNVNGTLVKTSMAGSSSSRRPSMAAGSVSRSATPFSRDDRSTPEGTRAYGSVHAEADYKFWQTPRTPSAAALGYNLDSIGMSPATPFYLSQRSKLVQQTCPPKQTRHGLFSKASEDAPSRQLKSRLEAARRKSLALKPSVRSPLGQ